VMPWNLATEITEQLAAISEWGGQFVVAIPSVRILDGPGDSPTRGAPR